MAASVLVPAADQPVDEHARQRVKAALANRSAAVEA